MFIIDGCQSQLFSMFSCILYDISALDNNIPSNGRSFIIARTVHVQYTFSFMYGAFVYKMYTIYNIHSYIVYVQIDSYNE